MTRPANSPDATAGATLPTTDGRGFAASWRIYSAVDRRPRRLTWRRCGGRCPRALRMTWRSPGRCWRCTRMRRLRPSRTAPGACSGTTGWRPSRRQRAAQADPATAEFDLLAGAALRHVAESVAQTGRWLAEAFDLRLSPRVRPDPGGRELTGRLMFLDPALGSALQERRIWLGDIAGIGRRVAQSPVTFREVGSDRIPAPMGRAPRGRGAKRAPGGTGRLPAGRCGSNLNATPPPAAARARSRTRPGLTTEGGGPRLRRMVWMRAGARRGPFVVSSWQPAPQPF